MKRENFGSRIGILAAAAGSAIGLGNIWKFPYITGANGGAAFIIVYLICIVLIGLPVLLSEFSIGRKGGSNAVEAFRKISPKSKWHWTGFLAVSTAFIILSFYAMIAGWVLLYIFKTITGEFNDITASGMGDYFNTVTSNSTAPIIATLIVLLITAVVLYFGVKSGIEKFSKFVMPVLLVLLAILMVRSVTLPGASKGLEFLFRPDFSSLTIKGVLEALGHSFYTLSLGMGIILTYGSYIGKKENIISLSYQVAVADTVIALMAGVVMFPAVFAYGLEPTAGPGLLFITLPAVFKSMPMGQLFQTLFFILIAIAAITSTVSLMETIVSFIAEQFNIIRTKAIVIVTSALFGLSIPSILSFGPLEGVKLLGERGIFDTLDFITGQVMLPIGGILICLFVAWIWGAKNAEKEITSEGIYTFKGKKLYEFSVKYMAPFAILVIFLYGIGVFKVF